jgi:hypothetical protein
MKIVAFFGFWNPSRREIRRTRKKKDQKITKEIILGDFLSLGLGFLCSNLRVG